MARTPEPFAEKIAEFRKLLNALDKAEHKAVTSAPFFYDEAGELINGESYPDVLLVSKSSWRLSPHKQNEVSAQLSRLSEEDEADRIEADQHATVLARLVELYGQLKAKYQLLLGAN